MQRKNLIITLEEYQSKRHSFSEVTNVHKSKCVKDAIAVINKYVNEAGQISDPAKFIEAIEKILRRDVCFENGIGKLGCILLDLQAQAASSILAEGNAGQIDQAHNFFNDRSGVEPYGELNGSDHEILISYATNFRTEISKSRNPMVIELFYEIRVDLCKKENHGFSKLRAFIQAINKEAIQPGSSLDRDTVSKLTDKFNRFAIAQGHGGIIGGLFDRRVQKTVEENSVGVTPVNSVVMKSFRNSNDDGL